MVGEEWDGSMSHSGSKNVHSSSLSLNMQSTFSSDDGVDCSWYSKVCVDLSPHLQKGHSEPTPARLETGGLNEAEIL